MVSDTIRRGSAVLGVGEVEAAAGVPRGALVAVGRDAAFVLEDAGHVQQVPRHERDVAVGEVVLRAARAGVEVRRARAGLADPAGVGLGRDDVAPVLRRVEDVHGAVLHPLLVPRHEATPDPPRAPIPPFLVYLPAAAEPPLIPPGATSTLYPNP